MYEFQTVLCFCLCVCIVGHTLVPVLLKPLVILHLTFSVVLQIRKKLLLLEGKY